MGRDSSISVMGRDSCVRVMGRDSSMRVMGRDRSVISGLWAGIAQFGLWAVMS